MTLRTCVFLSILMAVSSSVAPALAQTVVHSIPAPGPESRGLAWDGTSLWVADAELDSVFQVNPADGRVLHSFYYYLDASYGGMTWGEDGNLWLSDGAAIYLLVPSSGSIKYVLPCPGG